MILNRLAAHGALVLLIRDDRVAALLAQRHVPARHQHNVTRVLHTHHTQVIVILQLIIVNAQLLHVCLQLLSNRQHWLLLLLRAHILLLHLAARNV
jgi:hypothetical protein